MPVKISRFATLLIYVLQFPGINFGSDFPELENELGKPLILVVRTEVASPLAPHKVSSVEFAFWKGGLSYCASMKRRWVYQNEPDIAQIKSAIDLLQESIATLTNRKNQLEWLGHDLPYTTVYLRSESQTNMYRLMSSFDGIPKDMVPRSSEFQEFLKVWQRALALQERCCK